MRRKSLLQREREWEEAKAAALAAKIRREALDMIEAFRLTAIMLQEHAARVASAARLIVDHEIDFPGADVPDFDASWSAFLRDPEGSASVYGARIRENRTREEMRIARDLLRLTAVEMQEHAARVASAAQLVVEMWLEKKEKLR